jgi:hypothetical protein
MSIRAEPRSGDNSLLLLTIIVNQKDRGKGSVVQSLFVLLGGWVGKNDGFLCTDDIQCL